MTTQSEHELRCFADLLGELTFEFFGSGQHKITINQLLSESDTILLDIRSIEEIQTLALPFAHDVTTLHIPTNEIPDRLSEIPRDRPVAIFCSAGTRSAIVYAYLRIMGLERVRILVDSYPDITAQAMPGALWKRLSVRGRTS